MLCLAAGVDVSTRRLRVSIGLLAILSSRRSSIDRSAYLAAPSPYLVIYLVALVTYLVAPTHSTRPDRPQHTPPHRPSTRSRSFTQHTRFTRALATHALTHYGPALVHVGLAHGHHEPRPQGAPMRATHEDGPRKSWRRPRVYVARGLLRAPRRARSDRLTPRWRRADVVRPAPRLTCRTSSGQAGLGAEGFFRPLHSCAWRSVVLRATGGSRRSAARSCRPPRGCRRRCA